MDYNVTVIGAGIVGLAIARELSKQYENVLIIDKEESFGRGISSRSSEAVSYTHLTLPTNREV